MLGDELIDEYNVSNPQTIDDFMGEVDTRRIVSSVVVTMDASINTAD